MDRTWQNRILMGHIRVTRTMVHIFTSHGGRMGSNMLHEVKSTSRLVASINVNQPDMGHA